MIYPCFVYKRNVDGHVFWIAKSPMLNGCVGQGESAEEAIKEMETNETAWLETAKKYGISIPANPFEQAPKDGQI